MKRICRTLFLAAFILLILSGCGGRGLRYSQVNQDARDFHPSRMGILPIDVGAYQEAHGMVDQVISGVLVEKGWFQTVVAGNSLSLQLQSNEELKKIVTDYMAKLKAVNFSDPELSGRIGELCAVDAFLVVSVDYWNYTTENEDKVGKVGLKIKMINAATGKVLWTAGHSKAEKYWLLKPELPNVARALFKEMVADMPR